MSKRLMAVPAIVVMMAAISAPARAQIGSSDGLGGRVYFDLQKGLNDINKDYLTYSLRRVYFTYNMQISEKVKGRFRTDVGQRADGSYWVFLKHAYAEWQATGEFALRVGQQGTILFLDLENIWGYRSIAKTFHDYSNIRPPADIGVSGQFTPGETVSIRAMMSNGEGYREHDDIAYGKAYEVQGLFSLLDGLFLSVHYGRIGFDADGDTATADLENAVTIDMSVGYAGEGFAVGGSFTSQTNHRFNYGGDGTGFWVFGRYSLPGSPVSLLARYDNWDPDTGVDDNTEILLITGLDYTTAEGLNIIPNIQLEKLGNSDTVGTFLLTFYWKW